MDTLEAIMLIEGGEGDECETVEAWQSLIDSGIVWQLQGWYGRSAAHLIDAGICTAKAS